MQYQWTEWDEDVDSTPDEEYQSLVRSLRRKVGFGLFFVRCSPVGGQELIIGFVQMCHKNKPMFWNSRSLLRI